MKSVALLVALFAVSLPAQDVFISEFLSSNNGGLRDEDGDSPDWIEIFNPGTNTVNLNGWFLTDSTNNLTKWRFPSVNLAPNGFLIVFASGKNRTNSAAPLHANFSLNADGEYLALVRPDGVTIASHFAPEFPEQLANVSYGIAQNLQVTTLISGTAAARVLVPTNGALGTNWIAIGFNDSSWRLSTNGVGYESYSPGFAIRNFRANTSVSSVDAAEAVINSPSQQSGVFTETRNVVNYLNTESPGNFGSDVTFPGMTMGVNANDFVLEATGILTIPTTGDWTFGVSSDDGFRVDIGGNVLEYPWPRAPGDTFATFFLTAGEYPLRLVFFERDGGAEVEFFAAQGNHFGFNGSFRLVGDIANGGLAVKSVSASGGSSTSIRAQVVTDVQAEMFNRASSAYVRLPFNLMNPAALTTLTLRMKYDDGFVAYLNGIEIARRNTPASPQWNSTATLNRAATSAVIFEDIDVTSRLNLLQTASDLLAIHGLNDSATSTDFLIAAELVENKVFGTTNHYFSSPSPGLVNGSGTFAFVQNLKFTPGRGWFDNTNFSVTITSATPGVTIRYTTDGSAPSPTSGSIYSGAIPVSGTTVLRTVGYRNGYEPTEVETHSYIFLDDVQEDGNLSTAITQSPQYRDTFKSDLLDIPTLSIVMNSDDLFGPNGIWSNPNAQGVAWERPCSLEYMRPDGEDGFEINCGIRIQGGASRFLVEKHGFRVLFKSLYGPGKLKYELYPDSPVEEFDTLTIHAMFNDHWVWGAANATMQRDQWCRDTQNAMGGYGPHGTYAHLYLNGSYWGLFNIGEKGDASYGAHYLGGEKEEYDAFNSDENIDGDRVAWDQMFAIANAGITTDAAYNNLSQYLNIPNLIDYMLMNFYAATVDWPWHNWNAARRRVPGAGFHFFSWDAEWSFGIGANINTDRTSENAGAPGILYSSLRQHPEFRRLFGDHAHRHLLNGGALTPQVAEARWRQRSAEIDRAVIPESARWGNGHTRDTWLGAEASVLSWFPARGGILLGHLRNAGLYPQTDAPVFSQFGGLVPSGYALTIADPGGSGVIYYTINGADPRQWGGGNTPGARVYSTAIPLTGTTAVRARIFSGGEWSALVEATFYLVQDFSSLQVTEIMYRPPNFGSTNSDEVEFLELKNTGTNSLDLSPLHFTDGIQFAFTSGTRLFPGSFFVLARNAAAFTAKYPGRTVHGVYSNRLDNAGERLTLTHVLGTNVFSFTYNNAVPWPITPDGHGFSLVRANVNRDPDAASSWRQSANIGGSPGADDPAVTIPAVVINEILTHTDPPQIDAIELHNPTGGAANIGGWFLTDEATQPKKFRVPDGTVVPAGGFIVFDETNFNPQAGVFPSFALNSHGESLFLFSGDANTNLTGYSHSFDYGAAANGVTFGRYVISTSEENWPAMATPTVGTANSSPRIGPLVINEISFHPALGYDEFIEVHNLSSNAVPLYDTTFPTNRWRINGLGYTFPNNILVPAGGYLLLVPISPAQFRGKYGIAPAVQIIGPYAGALQDSGERLQLQRPDAPDTNGVPYIVVDEVRYNDKLPWPPGTDGEGPSLQRRVPGLYGNEPTNWFAGGITPGTANLPNQPPTSTLISPTNNATFAAPVTVTLTATATDSDGSIAQVEFYSDGVLIGIRTNAPYTFAWQNAPPGTHVLIARARDNRLAATASAPIVITINSPPVGTGIGLRGNYFGNMTLSGVAVPRLDSTVGFDWGSGSPHPSIGPDYFSVRWVGKVQPRYSEDYTFYTRTDDGVRLWVNGQIVIDQWVDQAATEVNGSITLTAGNLYDIKMEFYENWGDAVATLSWSSQNTPKEIIPTSQLYPSMPPTIVLTSPTTGDVFIATSTVNLSASASDPDGTVKVEFFVNGAKLGEDITAPFTIPWTNVPGGAHMIHAVAIDDSGLKRTSATAGINVLPGYTSNLTLIATGAVWKYHDQGADLSNVWATIAYDDNGWSNGPAQLGYGDGDERTPVGYGPDAGAKYITTYFRRAFTLTDPSSFTAMNLRVLRDDGVVVYLNGSEVYRNNMPSGSIGYQTTASTNVEGTAESSFHSLAINPGFLVFGANVVAVEIHQVNGSSDDISFDFELTGVQSFLAPYFTSQPLSQSVEAGANVTFLAIVAGTAPVSYQWRFNGTNLVGATNSTLVRTNVQAAHAGNYTLVATNRIGSATSQVAALTVIVIPDTDGDGMPDWWEIAHGLQMNNPADALLDADQDGMMNLHEYLASTDPQDANSVLRLEIFNTNGIALRFTAQSNLEYTIQFRTSFTENMWNALSNIAKKPASRTINVTDTQLSNSPARIYRVATPPLE